MALDKLGTTKKASRPGRASKRNQGFASTVDMGAFAATTFYTFALLVLSAIFVGARFFLANLVIVGALTFIQHLLRRRRSLLGAGTLEKKWEVFQM